MWFRTVLDIGILKIHEHYNKLSFTVTSCLKLSYQTDFYIWEKKLFYIIFVCVFYVRSVKTKEFRNTGYIRDWIHSFTSF